MRNILASPSAATLARFAGSRVLVAFDFDGTLAPVVASRGQAAMRPATRRWLAQVCERYPCAVISGRSCQDVGDRVAGLGVHHVVGNHGLEPSAGMARWARQVAMVHPQLVGMLSACPGVEVENKVLSLGIHYRASPSPVSARRAIASAVSRLHPPMRVTAGKMVVNLLPVGAPDKGKALLRVQRSERLGQAIYVGDDVTDEDVFRLRRPRTLMTIRVGRSTRSAADYFVTGQDQVDLLLRRLVELRPAA